MTFEDERILWRNEIKKGIINRKVVETQIVTTQRVLKNNYSIRLDDIVDIVISNQQRISNSQYTGFRPRYSYTSFGTSQSRSKTIGDVIFFHTNGETAFHQIEDPQSVVRVTKAARKKILAQIKESQRLEKVQSKKGVKCEGCGNSNPPKSAFCNKCGTSLNSEVSYVQSRPATLRPQSTPDQQLPGPEIESYSQVTTAGYSNAHNFEIHELLSEGIRIQYPSDWIVLEEELESPTITAFVSPLENAQDTFREPLLIQKHPIDGLLSIDECVKVATDSISTDPANTIVKTEPVILSSSSSRPAYGIMYNNGDLVNYLIIILEKNISGNSMTSYILISTIKKNKFEKFKPIIDKMADSFEII